MDASGEVADLMVGRSCRRRSRANTNRIAKINRTNAAKARSTCCRIVIVKTSYIWYFYYLIPQKSCQKIEK